MNILETFNISYDKVITIYIPDVHEKFNYYYLPSEALHKFDEITVILSVNTCENLLAKDIFAEIILSLRNSLIRLVKLDSQVPLFIDKCKFGYFWSLSAAEKFRHNIPNRFVWSTSDGAQTWIYNVDDEIWLEIGLTYPWLFRDPAGNEVYVPIEEWLINYKPLLCEKISLNLAQEWLNKCNNLLQQINLESGDQTE